MTRIKVYQSKLYSHILEILTIKQIRICSLSGFFALLITTVFPYLSHSPFWRHVTINDMENCRENWRYSLLLVHNYKNSTKMCLEPTWIFAAEFSLMIFAVIVLFVVSKFPKHTKIIFKTILLTSFTFIAFRIYTKKLTSHAIITPE